jgi:hypothetical protein
MIKNDSNKFIIKIKSNYVIINFNLNNQIYL